MIVFPEGDPHVMCSDPKVARGAALDVRRIKPAEQWPYRIVSERSGGGAVAPPRPWSGATRAMPTRGRGPPALDATWPPAVMLMARAIVLE